MTLGKTSFMAKVSDNGKLGRSYIVSKEMGMVKVPCIPSNSLKPFKGTFEVPVANWRSLAFSSLLNDRTARQNH